MTEALNIAAQFLDPVGGDHEDWSPTQVSKSLYRRSRYVWLGAEPGYPGCLLDRSITPATILLARTLDQAPNWAQLLDKALSLSQHRLALVTLSLDSHAVNPLFSYQELVERFLGLWRSEFVGQGGGHVILIDRQAEPTPRCFRKFPFFRRVHSTELVVPQPG